MNKNYKTLKASNFSLTSVILVLVLFVGCNQNSFDVDVSKVKVNTKLSVVHLDFFEVDTTTFNLKLQSLRQEYPFFYGSGTDGFWQTQFNDVTQKKIVKDIRKQFPNFSTLSTAIAALVQHYRYYFPEAAPIHPVAYFSNLDFDYPILLADTFAFIALDLYLGESYPAYKDLPNYLASERDKRYITRDVAHEIAKKYISEQAPDATFIDEIVYQGLVHYFIKSLVPNLSDADLFKYSEEQVLFCQENERMIWSYFIDNELLFSTSLDPKRRFVYPAPFSKFRTSFDADTPGRIGQWVGYQIVKAHAENNGKTLQELLQPFDGTNLLKHSKYKPK